MTDREFRQQLLRIYAEVDAAVSVANPRCDASGRCCRFTEWGHTLFLSQFEADLLLETAPGYEQPVSREMCPFQVDNFCTARIERPLGCRIYFCDPAYEEVGNAITESAVRKLKQLADESGRPWNYAPLDRFLNEAEPRPEGRTSVASRSSRITLPLAELNEGG